MKLTKTKTDIIIDATIDKIKVHSGFVRLFKEEDEIIGDIPIYQVNSFIIEGTKQNIPARLIKLCSQEKIPIHILTDLHKYYGSLNFAIDANILNRKLQYSVSLNASDSLFLAKQILHQKLKTQSLLCNHWQQPVRSESILEISESIKKGIKNQSLMGFEGRAAILYWDSFGKQCTGNGFNWEGRKKHPTLDPINSLLSLSYALLATQCHTALSLVGFDPYLGLLHTTNPDRPGLTYDIMEVYRVLLVDVWILEQFKQGYFTPDDFVFTKEGVCTLAPGPKNDFFKRWFKRLKYFTFSTNKGDITITEWIDDTVQLLLQWMKGLDSNQLRTSQRLGLYEKKMIVFKDIHEFSRI